MSREGKYERGRVAEVAVRSATNKTMVDGKSTSSRSLLPVLGRGAARRSYAYLVEFSSIAPFPGRLSVYAAVLRKVG